MPSRIPITLRGYLRNSAILMIGDVGMAGLGFLQGVVASRSMGPELFGAWSVILASGGFAQALFGARTTEALNRCLTGFREQTDRERIGLLLAAGLYVDALTSLGAWAFMWGGVLLVYPDLVARYGSAWLVFAFGGYLAFSGSLHRVWYAVARDARQFLVLAAIPLAAAAFRFGGVAGLALARPLSVADMVWVHVGAGLLMFLAQGGYLYVSVARRWGVRDVAVSPLAVLRRSGELRFFWNIMATMYLRSSVTSVVKHTDVLILGVFRPESEVGLYRVARTLASLMLTAGQALNRAMFQDAAELVVADRIPELRRHLRRVTLLLAPVVVLATATAIVLSPWLITLFYGQAFREAAPVFSLLVVGMAVATLVFWSEPVALIFGRLRQIMITSISLSVGVLLLQFALVPVYGKEGTAASLALAWALGYLLLIPWVPELWRREPRPAAASLASSPRDDG